MKKILDCGYVELIETWGSDERIIEAARMSVDKGFQGWGDVNKPGDEKLLAYLWKNKHTSPFEMAGAVFEIKAPIFVFREWHRHRTQSYNEMSARYTPLPNENYIPTAERCMPTTTTNKQAQGTNVATNDGIAYWLGLLEGSYQHAERIYQTGLTHGVPKEIARLCLPVARYSRMRAQAVLLNWLKFLTLRQDSRAQWEIRQYANAVGEFLEERFPRTYELFKQG